MGKALAWIVALGAAIALDVHLGIDARRGSAGSAAGIWLMLPLLCALLASMILRLRKRTLFDAWGVVDVGFLRTTALAWGEVTRCSISKQSLRLAKGVTVPGVLVRFISLRTDETRIVTTPRPRDRVIEVFLPDNEPPLPPRIVSLLKTIPQLCTSSWALLERPVQ